MTTTGDEPASTPEASTAASAAAIPVDGSAAPSAAATDTEEIAAEAAAIPSPPSIGYISHDESGWYVQDVSSGIHRAAEAAGMDLVACDSGATQDGVRSCAEELADAGVLGYISMQPFGDLAAEVCATVEDVPAVGIVYDQGPCQVALLEVDQAESGRLAGAALGALAAERWDCDTKAYVALGSGTGDTIGSARMDGYRAGFREGCKLPKQKRSLTDAQHVITAKTQMSQVLEEISGKPIMVAGVTDLAALGALEAAREEDRQNHVWTAGQLADPAARQAIACDGHYVASVAQFPDRFGDLAVPALLDAIDGREVALRLEAELGLVTAENVRELFPDTPACDA